MWIVRSLIMSVVLNVSHLAVFYFTGNMGLSVVVSLGAPMIVMLEMLRDIKHSNGGRP